MSGTARTRIPNCSALPKVREEWHAIVATYVDE